MTGANIERVGGLKKCMWFVVPAPDLRKKEPVMLAGLGIGVDPEAGALISWI